MAAPRKPRAARTVKAKVPPMGYPATFTPPSVAAAPMPLSPTPVLPTGRKRMPRPTAKTSALLKMPHTFGGSKAYPAAPAGGFAGLLMAKGPKK